MASGLEAPGWHGSETLPILPKYLSVRLFMSVGLFIPQAYWAEASPWGTLTWRLWSEWVRFLDSSTLSHLTHRPG